MTIGVVKETAAGERRVSLVPGSLRPLFKKGVRIVVEAGAGESAYCPDAAYMDAGARVGSRAEVLSCGLVTCVQPLTQADMALMRTESVLVGLLQPLEQPRMVELLAQRGITAVAMELVPRISRAQGMDALSAMASLAGYRGVLLAAAELPRFFPLLTTAAGTVRPATVLVLGAGVAGLQAIATARRLGARVWGYDIREAVTEEVQSLGAQFVELDLDVEDMEDAGGYARALMQAKAKQQTELLVPHVAKSDVVITTAQIPGRLAPTLVTEAAVRAMKPGSIVVDLAAATGGNCVLTQPDATVTRHGVTIMGPTNLPSTMSYDASSLYARTVAAMASAFIVDGQFVAAFDDAIFQAACVTYGGKVVNDRVNSLLEA